MIYKDIDKMLATAMKEHNEDLLRIYRLIKSTMQTAEKNGTVINDVNESKILLKMAAERKDSIRQYIDGGRTDLAEDEQKELDVINGLLPKQDSEEDVENYIHGTIIAYKATKEEGYKLSMKDMKPIMTIVQEKYPTANGKVISKVLQSVL